jgi:hypothetical protein
MRTLLILSLLLLPTLPASAGFFSTLSQPIRKPVAKPAPAAKPAPVIPMPTGPAPLVLSDSADLAKYNAATIPEGKIIDAAKSTAPFLTGGAVYKSGLHFQGAVQRSGGVSTINAFALMTDPSGKLFYRKFTIEISQATRAVTTVNIDKDIALSDTHFSVNAGLLDRMVVVEDAANDLTLAFPLGVGGIDEAVISQAYRILTPRFHGVYLTRGTVQPSRTDPTYYRARPFMPITEGKNSPTAIAFHITILDDGTAARAGLNYLQRGFESHGCMRMREKDLMEFFAIVMQGGSLRLPVDVDYHVAARNAQGLRVKANGITLETISYPLENDSFMRVTRFPYAPFYQRTNDKEHLVIMDRSSGQPDFRRLGDGLVNASDFEQNDEFENRFDMP